VALAVAAWAVIVLVAWCRVWLGVHWTSDVVGSLAVVFVALTAAETAIYRRHKAD
jgi:membrane-associated phospholipid phosphatase